MSCGNCDHLHNCHNQCMALPEHCTCAVCIHVNRCVSIFGVKPENTHCDFSPIRFELRADPAFVKDHGLDRRQA